jgi:hypothetical protein
MADRELAQRDPALDPTPTEIREDAEREVEEVRRAEREAERERRERARELGDDTDDAS